jgi:hypothetical protein
LYQDLQAIARVIGEEPPGNPQHYSWVDSLEHDEGVDKVLQHRSMTNDDEGVVRFADVWTVTSTATRDVLRVACAARQLNA